jgi:hypothetical protein
LAGLPVLAAMALRGCPPWVLMWGLAAALWLGLKFVTLLDVWESGLRPRACSLLGYVAGWPGMDGARFFNRRGAVNPEQPSCNQTATFSRASTAKPSQPAQTFRSYLTQLTLLTCLTLPSGLLNITLGLAMLYVATPAAQSLSWLLSGWLGMAGLILVLHFGIFQLLAKLWQERGVNVVPLMDAPFRAMSLSEFWGRRWNTGFSLPARRYLLQPLMRRIGVRQATLVVFLVSGLMHELVISVPAGWGYGLPSGYFLLQGVGAMIERSARGRALGLGKGWRGGALTWLCAAAPAFWLFHPRFVERVMIPFLKTIGALKGVSL